MPQGVPRNYLRPGGSGAPVERAFCGDCGTPLWSAPAHEPFLTVKVGAFDEVADLAPQLQVYVSSAPAWHPVYKALPSFAQMPPRG